ncbi:MAG: serine--tRNA ligase [Planctomycetota bacterium]|jgi:seryl-tRNA synthetase
MLDIKRIREEPEAVKAAAAAKNEKADVDRILELDGKRRDALKRVEGLKAERNAGSKDVGKRKKAGEDTSELQTRIRAIGEEIKAIDSTVAAVTEERDALMAWVPNVPAADVPVGADESANELVREWGEKPEFAFEPKAHWDIGAALGVIDLERASKVSGAGFTLFKGAGARLERALWSFMLDLHTTEHGYVELLPPYLANRNSMFGTGQIPKLEEDMYGLPEDGLFLIPTAEVPVTNYHAGEIIPGAELPLCYTAYTACFRREAGAYGRDTRGMIRVHQFDKVEMVRFVRPETSYDELEKLVGHAEEVLKRLGLHYRVLKLCTGDLSFAAAKCYDIEVWAPGVGRYLEVSSCSNFEDFQARRASIRFRDPESKSVGFVHTLNGSGVALPRAFVAILETFQHEDGSVTIPEVLRPYMGGVETLEPAETKG